MSDEIVKYIDGFFALGSNAVTDQFKRDLLERLVSVETQTFTTGQKLQARTNIGASSVETFLQLSDTPAAYPVDTYGRMVRHFGAGLVFSTYLGEGDGAWALDPFSRTDTPVVFGEGEATLQLGIYYLLTVTVSDRTTGSITILADTTELATITTNGTHEIAFLSTWDNVTVVFSITENDGFDGDLTFDNLKSVALTNPTGLRLFEANHIDVAGGIHWHNQNFAFAKLPTNFFGSGNLYWGDQSAVDLNEVNKLRVSDIITGDLTTGDLVFKSNLTFHAGTAYDVTFPAAGALVAGRFPYVSKTTPGAELSWSVYSFPVTLPGASSVPLISAAGAGSWLSESSIAKLSGLTSGYVPFYNGTNLADSGVYWDAINGRAGIGTTTPNAKLEVNSSYSGGCGSLQFSSSIYGGRIDAIPGSSAGNLYVGASSGLTNFYKSGVSSYINMLNNLTELKVQINSNGYSYFNGGNVGIGTTTPTTTLDVFSAGALLSGLTIQARIISTEAMATGVGGVLSLGGEYVTGGPYTNFGAIKGGKENATETSYASYLGFYTRSAGASLTEKMRISSTGNVGIGTTIPTARLHIAAGTATAGTSPLKFTSGTLLTAPEAGAVEFVTDAYYATITTGTARKTFAFLESPVFTGTVETPAIKITTGAAAGYFLTSAADGAASWAAINQMVYPGAGLAVSTGSAWGTSIADNSTNWNSAYGWGNHASAGYWVTPTGTNGDIIYYNSGWQKLAKGTDGHFLKLASGIPSWAAVNESKWTTGNGNIYHVGDVAIGTSSANPGALAIFGENGNFYTQGDYTTHSKHTASVNPLLYISDETETSPQPLISMLTKNSGSWIVCAKGATTPFELYNAGNFKAAGLTYPSTDGTANQVLKTNGSGVLGWATVAASQWTTDTHGITYTAGNVGLGAASNDNYRLYLTPVGSDGGIYINGGSSFFALYALGSNAAGAIKCENNSGHSLYAVSGGGGSAIRAYNSSTGYAGDFSKPGASGGSAVVYITDTGNNTSTDPLLRLDKTCQGNIAEFQSDAVNKAWINYQGYGTFCGLYVGGGTTYKFTDAGAINALSLSIEGTSRIASTGIANFVSLKIDGTERISSAGVFTPSNGVSGSWTTVDGKTITATNGIITAIV